ncbi:hypothetical protein H4N58_11180 [Mumia sp. ZJ1417]|uniref:SCO7613 C-terminal domain-containing membrane protein n=1 Tax=Mumia sp. ZJ1417 TaxID=2708082 RepID=UPI00141F9DFC|nr:hypothetical protein [Mumia sp. ZJ1417]QMW64812.1 hypothetical protein H4N58_11180 [Mumia sp. ZJ1417]
MTYADPLHCPSCGAPAAGVERCPRCGVQLRGERPLRLLGLLAEADRVLAEMRAEAAATAARPAGPSVPSWSPSAAGPAAEAPQQPSSYGAQQPPPWSPRHPAYRASSPRHTWSVGGTLLALGSLCLVVAGFVFVAVGWGSLGLTGRTLVLVALTTAVAGAAAWVTTRRLRASAEALWTVCGLLAAVDVGAGVRAGVLGLDTLDADLLILGFSAVLAVASLGVALWARQWLRRVVAAEVGLVIGLVTGTVAALVVLPVDLRWTLTAASAGLVLATLGLVRLRLTVAAWAVGLCAAGAVPGSAAVLVTAVAISDGAATRWTRGDAPALLLLGAVTAGLAALVARTLEARALTAPATLARAFGGFGAALCLVVVALLGRGVPVEVATLTWVLVPLATAGVGARLSPPGWATGVRATLVPAALPLVGALLATGGAAGLAVAESWLPGWDDDVALRFTTEWGDPVWLVACTWLGAAAVVAVVACWRAAARAPAIRTTSWVVVALLSAGGVVVVGVLLEAPVLVVALSALGVAGAAGATWLVRGSGDLAVAAACTAPPAAVVAVLLPIGSAPAAATVWCAVAMVAALVTVAALSDGRRDAAAVAAGSAAALGVAGVLAWVDVSGAGLRTGALVASGLVVALLASASVPTLPRSLRVPWEIVAGGTACLALVEALDASLGWFSLCLTVLGVAVTVAGILRYDRRPYMVLGTVLLGTAYVTRLAASDVDIVEAYTLPFGLLLLAAGLLRMRHQRGQSSAALLPGLGLALLPSLPATLDDPASVRGLLLAAAGIGLLAVGTVVRQKAPFVVGATLTTLLVVRWAGPFVGDLPRWIPLGAVGLALVLAGATWEARVRDARAVVAYVRTLR